MRWKIEFVGDIISIAGDYFEADAQLPPHQPNRKQSQHLSYRKTGYICR